MRARLVRLGCATLAVAAALVAAGLPTSAFEESSGIRDAGSFERIPSDARQVLGAGIVPPGYDKHKPGDAPPSDPLENKRYQYSGTMLAFPEMRQMWQVFPNAGLKGAKVLVRDLDTMRIKAGFDLGTTREVDRATDLRGGEWTHAVDRVKGRLFFLAIDPSDHSDEVIEIDMRALKVTARYPLLQRVPGLGKAITPMAGFSYDPGSDSLIGIVNAKDPAGFTSSTFVVALNVRTKTPKLRQLQACDGQQPAIALGDYNIEILVSDPGGLYITCNRAGNVAVVVRIDRSLDPATPEDLVIGPTALEGVLVDQIAKRILAITSLGEIWVFDVPSQAFVGLISAASQSASNVKQGYGLDYESGRVFFQSPTFGFGVAEGRFFPVPQALTRLDRQIIGQERIWSDGRTGRAFVLEGRNDIRKTYRVYQVGKAPAPPPQSDPDANTVNRVEKPGVTESQFFGKGSGYGFRALLTRGISTIVPAPSIGTLNPVADAIVKNINSRCGFDERQIMAGRVTEARYDTGSTTASAVEVDIDGATQQQIDEPSRCHVEARNGSTSGGTADVFNALFGTSPFPPPVPWPSKEPLDNPDPEKNPRFRRVPAACSTGDGYAEPAGGKDTSKAEGQTADYDIGKGEVACPVEMGKELTASGATRLYGAIDVALAENRVSIKREGGDLVTTSTSVARGINIADVIQIGEIRANAVSRSNGRPRKGAASTYDFSISGLVINGQAICGAGTQCNRDDALRALNRAGAGRVQFRMGSGYDTRLRQGTPKGALTAVTKSEQRQESDRALIGDFSNEVPALEMVIYNENATWGRARQIFQFAGVATTAGYTIAVLPTGQDVPPIPDSTIVVPGTPDSPGTPGTSGGSGTGTGTALPADDGTSGVVAAIARGLRLMLTNPRQGLLLMTAWSMLGLPFVLARRRRRLADL